MKKQKPNFSYLENKGYNITNKQFQNLLAFLAIMLGDYVMVLMDISPDYICKKFNRYINIVDIIYDSDNYKWGLHPVLQKDFINKYYERWGSMLNWSLSEKLNVL